MNKLQASMKDSSAKAWRESKVYYKVGSYFKGCCHCGETEEIELPSGKIQVRYLSGHNVFRAYDPQWTKWTFYCWDCSAKDLQCWEEDSIGSVAAQLGKPAICGTASAKRAQKMALRKSCVGMETKVVLPSRSAEIARLEAKLAELMALLNKGGR
jgi:hypothetical protein